MEDAIRTLRLFCCAPVWKTSVQTSGMLLSAIQQELVILIPVKFVFIRVVKN